MTMYSPLSPQASLSSELRQIINERNMLSMRSRMKGIIFYIYFYIYIFYVSINPIVITYTKVLDHNFFSSTRFK